MLYSYSNRTLLLAAAFLLLISVAAGAYLQEFLLPLIPLALAAFVFLLQNPRILFYGLMLSIPWSIEYNFTPTLGTDLPDEPLMLLTALAAIMLMIHQRKKMMQAALHPLLVILLIHFAWLLVTVATSSGVLLSAKYLLAKSWYLLAFVAAPLILFKDPSVLKKALFMLFISMMAFMIYAIIKHEQYGFTFEKINTALEPFYRNHVNYSAILVFMVPVQIAIYKLTTSKKTKQFIKIIFIITLVALYLSYARGAWLALIAGFIAYWLIRRKLLLAAYLCFLLVCAGAVLYLKSNDRYLAFAPDYNTTIWHSDFRDHLVATYTMKDVSTAERFHRWVGGVRMIPDSWQTGFGPGTFYHQYKSYTQPLFKTWVSKNEEKSTVHNYFLLLIIEQGLIGLLLFAALLGGMFWYVQRIYHSTNHPFWKQAMAAVGAILLMQCVINSLSDLIESDKVGSVFYLCLATVILASQAVEREAASGKLQAARP